MVRSLTPIITAPKPLQRPTVIYTEPRERRLIPFTRYMWADRCYVSRQLVISLLNVLTRC